jgi:hypothetical protein
MRFIEGSSHAAAVEVLGSSTCTPPSCPPAQVMAAIRQEH